MDRPQKVTDPPTDANTNYANLVAKAGLFGKAFFGHKKTKVETKKLDRLWKYAQKLAGGENQATG